MKQAIADETKQGLAAKAYMDKGMMGKVWLPQTNDYL